MAKGETGMSVSGELKLLAYFKELRRKPDLSTLASRRIFQKLTYFVQEMGLNLGYSFGWYIYGPYSPGLASTGFTIVSQQGAYEKEIPPIEDAKPVLSRVREFLNSINEICKEKDEDFWLELLSSCHFLNHHAYPQVKNPYEAWQVLEMYKKGRFSQDDVKKAWDILTKYQMVK